MSLFRRERVFSAPRGGEGRIFVASSRLTGRVKHVCVWDGSVWHVAPKHVLCGGSDAMVAWLSEHVTDFHP